MDRTVSITRCGAYDDAAVYKAVKDAIGLIGGMERFVKKGERILIKPNLLAGRPPGAAVTTHPGVVRSVIRLVKEARAIPLVGDSPGLGTPRRIAEKCGVLEACRAEGAEFLELRELVEVENPGGHTFKRLEVAKEALGVDGIINVPKLKTHAQMFLTLGVKNMFGCVPGKKKAQWHLAAGSDSLYFAGMLLDLYLFLRPRFTVMDGVLAMEGNGPGNGTPRRLGLIFCGEDAIAVDAVITEAVGAKASQSPILRAAGQRGIKSADVSQVTVLGEGLKDIKVRDFRFPPPLISVNFTSKLPYFIDRPLRKALTSRPHINTSGCTVCGICVDVCPPRVMKKAGKVIIDYDMCIRCFCCQEMCPEGAISPRDGWLKKILPGI